jgi:hypothetical protein
MNIQTCAGGLQNPPDASAISLTTFRSAQVSPAGPR